MSSKGSRGPSAPRVVSVSARNPGTAGACTVDDFENNFYNVPKISITNGSELMSFFNEKICPGLNASDIDWEKRVLALKHLRSIVLCEAYLLPEFLDKILPNLELPLEKAIKDLRSQVVREAAYTIALYCKEMGAKMFRIVDLMFQPAISVVQSSAKVMSSSATILFTYVTKYVRNHKLIQKVSLTMTHKSREIRRSGAVMTKTILENWDDSEVFKEIGSICDAVFKAINDADPEVREQGRSCFYVLEEKYKDEAEKIFKMLDPSKKRSLNGGLATSSSSRSIVDAISASKPNTASSIRSNAYARATSEIDTTSARRAMITSKYGSSTRPPLLGKSSLTQRNSAGTLASRKNNINTLTKTSQGLPSTSQPNSRSGSPKSLMRNFNRMKVSETPKVALSSKVTKISSRPGVGLSAVPFELDNDARMESAAFMDAINKCNTLSDKREALTALRQILEHGRPLVNLDIDKAFQCLWKLYKESQNRPTSELMGALDVLFKKYNDYLVTHLNEIYPRILMKMANDTQPMLRSAHLKLLEQVKKLFSAKDRFASLTAYLQNPLHSPHVKAKQLLLKEYAEIIPYLDSQTLRGTAAFVPSFLKILHILESKLLNLDAAALSELINIHLTPQQRQRVLNFINKTKVSMSPLKTRQENVIGQVKDYVNSTSNYNSPYTNGRERSYDNNAPTSTSSTCSNLDYDTSKFFYNNAIEFKHDVEEQNRIITIIQAELMPDNDSIHKSHAAKALEVLTKDKCFTLWDTHFGSTLMLLIQNLSADDDNLVTNVACALKELISKEHNRLGEYYAYLIKSFISVKRRSDRIHKALDNCSDAMAKFLPAPTLIETLIPHLKVDDPEQLTNALKLLGKVFEYIPLSEAIPYLSRVCPYVVECIGHTTSSVRRGTIICMVSIINKCGRSKVDQYLVKFDRSQIRLLEVYLEKSQPK
ncbi:Armadillo-like helical domain and Armadillo-type fold domain and CLASP N-terminal domain-containing protein [Strongyloides ratti]|uniref:Armadillo-like helical domain and Armadillo-type fold domain and CLASP N-terminal domain-containing protein n=1 Tax=Strongyloides ratti TaxID=34506 RepID=A0A090L8X2_STRRB|nr:Armadillo-like helical domain and Armadillo-type fold domain and CLASP N-terminal domain-containing protein [Strongyloides ratti]CEF64598.1 Armadillo-like helical domain and Armadillo-type fold domain and CLASP N-terminal domain-containing protein [Strongyloides ratti]